MYMHTPYFLFFTILTTFYQVVIDLALMHFAFVGKSWPWCKPDWPGCCHGGNQHLGN